MESCRICPFAAELFPWACPQGSSVLQKVSEFPSFSRVNNILLCVYTTFGLSIIWPWTFGLLLLLLFSCSACPTLCNPVDCSTPGFPVLHYLLSLLRFMSIESVMPSNHLILSHPLLLLPVFPSIKVFSNESVVCIRWPKCWSFSFCTHPSNEYSGVISFRIDWLYLLVVQGTLKNVLQHHSSKASILWLSAFFTVQLSHPNMTTGKRP